MKKENKFSIKN